MQKSIQTILQQPMDRKDFLKHLGAMLLIASGSGIIAGVLHGARERTLGHTNPASPSSYGSSRYGG